MAPGSRGLFGGTFDPPHLGHLAAARAAIEALDLDELVVTVARDPQLKDARPVAPAEVRYEMACAAFGDVARCVVSDLELRRSGPTYSIDTVEALLSGTDPTAARLVLVVGADAAATLPRWHRAGELAGLVYLAVLPRPGAPSGVPEGFEGQVVTMAPVDLSSTWVREALGRGQDPSGLLPGGVVPLVLANRLYSP